MKSSAFQYELPEDLSSALKLLDSKDMDILPLAGGQSLMPMMNFRVAQPDILVDLNKIDSLKNVKIEGDNVKIGSMVRYCELEQSDIIQKHFPLIIHVIPYIAHSAIRNRGTLGGSVSLADPAAEMPSILIALNASIELSSSSNTRTVNAEDFFKGIFETDRKSNELVTSINIPITASPKKFGFYEVTRRHGDYAMAGAVVTSENNENVFNETRVVLFAVSTKPMRLTKSEDSLNGKKLDDQDAINSAIEAVSGNSFESDLHNDEATKETLAKVSLKRAIGGLNG
ncbi:MAG: xanthine dehydrogenase family protein subunit M [Alphaproteobacteria bacterium]|nr:xanthine dehydrogenase family protein subunit M [Alphaproteobacteria bacterium]